MEDTKELRRALTPYVAKGEVEKQVNIGFEYACLEAEHMNIPKEGQRFNEMCNKGIYSVLVSVAEFITEQLPERLDIGLEELIGTNIELPKPTHRNMKEWVMYTHNSKHWKDYMPPKQYTPKQREVVNDLVIRCNRAYHWKDEVDEDEP